MNNKVAASSDTEISAACISNGCDIHLRWDFESEKKKN